MESNRNELEQLMIAALYGECSDADHDRLRRWLAEHPEDRNEFECLKKTFAMLEHMREIPVSPVPPNIATYPWWTCAQRKLGWIAVAAACLLMLFVGSMRGFQVQIGQFRLAFGPVTESDQVLVQLNDLIKTIDTMHTYHDLISKRQDILEASYNELATYQKMSQALNDQKIRRAVYDVINGLDQKLQNIYPVSYPVPGGYASNTIEPK